MDIVMSSNASVQGLIYLAAVVRQLALDLLTNGLLIRGAIAKGPLHHVGSVMFGPAFLDAYRIERDIAKYPRIILSQATYEDFRSLTPGLRDPSFILDNDGPPYQHILQGVGQLKATALATIEYAK